MTLKFVTTEQNKKDIATNGIKENVCVSEIPLCDVERADQSPF